jgi:hypothetical protein
MEQMKQKWLSLARGCAQRCAAWLTESKPEKNSRTASKPTSAEFATRFALTRSGRSCKRSKSTTLRLQAQARSLWLLLENQESLDNFRLQYFVIDRLAMRR